MPISRQVLLEKACRAFLLKANWMSNIKKKKKKKKNVCNFSPPAPWLSSDNYSLTTRVKLKLSTVSGYEMWRDTVNYFRH